MAETLVKERTTAPLPPEEEERTFNVIDDVPIDGNFMHVDGEGLKEFVQATYTSYLTWEEDVAPSFDYVNGVIAVAALVYDSETVNGWLEQAQTQLAAIEAIDMQAAGTGGQ